MGSLNTGKDDVSVFMREEGMGELSTYDFRISAQIPPARIQQ